MDRAEFEDLTGLFLRLQSELESAAIGRQTSLEAQLKAAEADLSPLFNNVEMLATGLGSGGLTYEHAFLKRTNEWSPPRLLKLLAEYRDAQKVDERALFVELAAFLPRMDTAYRHVVSIAELEADKSQLKAFALARSCLRDMGDLIESTLRPFLNLRLRILQICGAYTVTRQVDDLSLGDVVSDLTKLDPDLYTVAPFDVSLSQWRNISHHSSYKAVGEKIVCEYGQGSHKKKIDCSPEQLIQLFQDVEKTYYLHKVAFEIFSTDNIQILAAAERATGANVEVSELSHNSMLAYGIVASGFRILKIGRKDFRWALLLVDRHDRSEETSKAALQAAVVTYLLHSKSKSIQLNAWIDTHMGQHFISFQGDMRQEPGLTPEEYALFKLNRNFRIDEDTT